MNSSNPKKLGVLRLSPRFHSAPNDGLWLNSALVVKTTQTFWTHLTLHTFLIQPTLKAVTRSGFRVLQKNLLTNIFSTPLPLDSALGILSGQRVLERIENDEDGDAAQHGSGGQDTPLSVKRVAPGERA